MGPSRLAVVAAHTTCLVACVHVDDPIGADPPCSDCVDADASD